MCRAVVRQYFSVFGLLLTGITVASLHGKNVNNLKKIISLITLRASKTNHHYIYYTNKKKL